MARISKLSIVSIGPLLGLALATQTVSAVTAVEVKDAGSDSFVECGDLSRLSVVPAGDGRAMQLEMTGNCLGTAATPVVQDIQAGTVNEGSSITIHVAQGAVVEIPYTTSVSSPPPLGTVTVFSSEAGILRYAAPTPGTVSTSGAVVSFGYSILDGSGNSASATATVSVNSIPAATPCVEGETIRCMGALSEWPSGTMFNRMINPGNTHIWYVDYDKTTNNDGLFMLFDGGLKMVSLSPNANDFTLGFPCQITQEAPQQPLQYAFAEVAGWYQCGLVDGGRYYLSIKSTLVDSPDPYTLTVR